MSGSTTRLAGLLSSDIRLTTDTGGKTVAAARILEREDVFNALNLARVWWARERWPIFAAAAGRPDCDRDLGQSRAFQTDAPQSFVACCVGAEGLPRWTLRAVHARSVFVS